MKFRAKVKKSYEVDKKERTRRSAKKLRLLQRQYKTEIRRRKRRAWARYKVNLESNEGTAKFMKSLQSTTVPEVSVFKKPDGSHTVPGKETAEFLIKSHFPEAQDRVPVRHMHRKIESKTLNGKYNTWVNKNIVMSA